MQFFKLLKKIIKEINIKIESKIFIQNTVSNILCRTNEKNAIKQLTEKLIIFLFLGFIFYNIPFYVCNIANNIRSILYFLLFLHCHITIIPLIYNMYFIIILMLRYLVFNFIL